jgi:hypothetical protein
MQDLALLEMQPAILFDKRQYVAMFLCFDAFLRCKFELYH